MSAFYTPLRYPGGKGKITPYVKAIFDENGLVDGVYGEPYAGGAGVALELLFHEYATHIYINDVSPSVGAFWRSVLDQTDGLCRMVRDTRITMTEWRRQKQIQTEGSNAGDLALGFSTFFLNRTNRSGILAGGVIGGKDQTGPWKIDARFNVPELIDRINAIAKIRTRITFTQYDALDFLAVVSDTLPQKSLIYLDPPYYIKGKELYLHYYLPDDHTAIATFAPTMLAGHNWIVSYDNVPEIREMYREFRSVKYALSYSAQDRYNGSEIMFYGPGLKIPRLVHPMRKVA